MRALFGAGIHPLAAARLEQFDATDLTDTNIKTATRLGAPFKVYTGEVSPFRIEVAKRIAARQAVPGGLGDDPVSAADRAQVRTEVAREFFRAEHGRDPIDAREIAATIAKKSRPRTQTVAGYDPHVAAQIEEAHQAAVRDALNFIESHALFTRQGRNGIRQVNVTGLVATSEPPRFRTWYPIGFLSGNGGMTCLRGGRAFLLNLKMRPSKWSLRVLARSLMLHGSSALVLRHCGPG